MYILFYAVYSHTIKKDYTEPCKEFNLDHFILHVTTSAGSIKNICLQRTANETIGSFDVMEKGKHHNHILQRRVKEGTTCALATLNSCLLKL